MIIRQLIWDEQNRDSDEFAYSCMAKADPCEFRYEIDKTGTDRKPYRVTRSCNIQPFAFATSIDMAKQAAQIDFEKRIRSAFTRSGEIPT